MICQSVANLGFKSPAGRVHVNGVILTKGDGFAIEGGGALIFGQGLEAEFLLFDLAP